MITRAVGARKGVRVWLPRGLDFSELLPPELWPHADGGRLFLGRIVDGHADNEGFVTLSSRLLRDDIGRDVWPRIRRALEPVVETRAAEPGWRCAGYRLALGGKPVSWPLHDPRIVGRVWASRERYRREQERRLLPVHKALRAVLRSQMTVDDGIDDAITDLDTWAQTYAFAAVERIRAGRPAFKVGLTRRVFSTFTGLCKSLRPFVRLDGEPIVGLDIRAAQPSLLAAIPDLWVGRHHHTQPLGQNGCPHIKYSSLGGGSTGLSWWRMRGYRITRNVGVFFKHLDSWVARLGPDFDDYRDVCSGGDVYIGLADMVQRAGLAVPDGVCLRDWVKKRFLVDVVNASSRRYRTDFCRLVAERWPSVVWLAEQSRGTLIAGLQRLESAVVVERVAPDLLSAGLPVLTLHDAVYIRESDESAARGLFQLVLDELRLPLRLKNERDVPTSEALAEDFMDERVGHGRGTESQGAT